MLFNFFPSLADQLVTSRIGNALIHHLLFPSGISLQCPEILIAIPWMHQSFLRQPCLFVMAITGVAIGLRGAWSLSNYWSFAFGSFAIMNISAVFLHCIWLLDDSTYPDLYPITWTIDTYMTGVSSVGLLIASLETCTKFRNLQQLFGTLQGIGILCIVWFYAKPLVPDIAFSYPLELWYFIPQLLAGPPLIQSMFGGLIRNPISFQWTSGHILFVCGILSAVLGIGFDWFWCRTFGTLFADLLRAPTLVFGGCNLCFLGIHQWIQQSKSKKRTD